MVNGYISSPALLTEIIKGIKDKTTKIRTRKMLFSNKIKKIEAITVARGMKNSERKAGINTDLFKWKEISDLPLFLHMIQRVITRILRNASKENTVRNIFIPNWRSTMSIKAI